MKDDKNNKSNFEKDEEKRNDIEANDIRSRLRKNPNKTKPLYDDEYTDKKNKKKVVFPPNEKEICRTILDILKKDEKSTLFRQPAIKAFTDKEDRDYYKQQIKEPRDLGNISKKLKSSKYSSKEFYEDIELCWSNAQSFNDIETEAYKNSVYMKDLSNKLYIEYGLLDIINKKENNNISENITENNDNNEIIDNTSENNENNNGNDNDNDSNKTNIKIINNNETKNKKVGRKRKRYNDINDNLIDNDKVVKKIGKKTVNNDLEGKNSMASNSSRTIRSTIFDIKNKFKVTHPIVSNPDEIEILLNNMNSNKGNANKRNNITNLFNNSKKKKKTHYHHKKKQHLGHLKNMEKINSKKLYKNNNTEIIRKINYEWNEIMRFNESINYCINNKNDNLKEKINDEEMKISINNNYNRNNSLNDKENNNLNIYNIFNIHNYLDNNIINDNQKSNKINFNLNLNFEKPNKAENEDMIKFDYNCNAENVLDLEAMMENRRKSSLRQSMQSSDINRNNNQYSSYNNNFEKNYLGNRNNTRKTMDKNFKLRNEVAKYLDKLSDNNMIELLVFIENIRPQCIKELANDTIYINMESFNDDTFAKVIDFLKKYA